MGPFGGANVKKKSLDNLPTVTINAVENPNSCIIKIGKQNFKPLLDTGAAVSLVNSDVYWSLPYHSKLSKPKVNLKSVIGADLKLKVVQILNLKLVVSHCLINFMLLKMLIGHSYWEEIGWLKMVSDFWFGEFTNW